jgi:hypothetical protein
MIWPQALKSCKGGKVISVVSAPASASSLTAASSASTCSGSPATSLV